MRADRTVRSHANPAYAANSTCRDRAFGMLARAPELHLRPARGQPFDIAGTDAFDFAGADPSRPWFMRRVGV